MVPYRVLVNQIHGFLRIYDVAGACAVDVFLFDFKVFHGFLPDDLDGGGHDHVWVVPILTLCLALVLPALLHGEDCEHDCLGGADGRSADCLVVTLHRCVE